MNITDMTLCELIAALDGRKISSEEATKACLEQIKAKADLNNFITVCEDEALRAAKQADALRKKGKALPLLGVPIAVKDNIVTDGIRTTCASAFLKNFVPPYDATVVEKLKASGAVIVGKTNMDEFAMGSTNENSAFGVVKNSLDTCRVPGGSSGGSANCVAARQAFGALGSDTGGSIRQPASYCGVVGLKPTYSAVSRYGLIAFASSLDQIGTLTRDCDDARVLLQAIVGKDARDTTSGEPPVLGEISDNVKGKVFAIADEFINTDKLDDGVRAEFESAVKELEKRGAKIKHISIKSFNAALSVYYVLSGAEASSNLARFDGVKYGMRAEHFDGISDLYTKSRTQYFGAEVKRRIMTGSYVLSSGYYDAYYLKASKIRTVIKSEFDGALSACDALLCPTAPTVAPKLGEQSDPHETYLSDMYTVPVNIAGLPAVSVPFGKVIGMPVGIQIIGRSKAERDILGVGKAIMTAAKELGKC